MKRIATLALIALLSFSGAALAQTASDQGWNKGYETEHPVIHR